MEKNLLTVYLEKSFLIVLLATFLSFFTLSSFGQNAVTTLCGSNVQGNPLWGPNGICINHTGTELYVADYNAHRIKKILISTGGVTNFAGDGTSGFQDGALLTAKFSYPSGLKMSSDGFYVYVADNGNCLIRKIDVTTGIVSTIAGVYNAFGYGDSSNGLFAEFNQPIDLVVAPGDSIIYISDSENHVIRKLNLTTTAVTTLAGVPGMMGSTDGTTSNAKFRNPTGLCLSSDGNSLYVADAGNHKIRKIDLINSVVITLAGSGTAGNTDHAVGTLATFNNPQGISILPNDSILYCIDTYNHLVRAIDINTSGVTTIAGSSVTPQVHFADSPNGLLAKFYQPANSVLSVNADKLYISDQQNFRVRTMNTDLFFTSVEENQWINSIIMYPNPAVHSVNIEINTTTTTELTYSVVDITGTLVIDARKCFIGNSNQIINIPLSQLQAGIYFIKININSEIRYLKLIKYDP